MKEKIYYELTPSQDVINLQCKYTLFKRVVNILFSATCDAPLKFTVLEKAYNKVVERNDCLRLHFTKKGKKDVQYFKDYSSHIFVPVLTFKTKNAQEQFIDKQRKKAIAYKKGVVIEPYFINTYDNKQMVFIKVCHLVLDIYGINNIFNDLFSIYDALINKSELPEAPTTFESVIQKDLTRKHNTERHKENYEFFHNLLTSNEEPYYTGINGPSEPIYQKQVKKGKRAMKMFFIHNDTIGYEHPVSKEVMDKVLSLSERLQSSPTNILLYACALTASRINGNKKVTLPLELCNCRGSAAEKNCAGTKVQSIGCLTTFDFESSFAASIAEFTTYQTKLYRRLGFPDQDFEMMLHKIHPSNMLETYYSTTFSYIPYQKMQHITYDMYSNGKGALPCYIAFLHDVVAGDARICYDVQSKIISESDVEAFHKNYIKVLNQLADNPDILLKDVAID